MSGEIESRPLPLPNSRTTITAADRAAVYQRIRKSLDDILNGESSYWVDGGRKDPQTLLSDLDGFIGQVDRLSPFVNDSSGVVPGVVRDLRQLKKALGKSVEDAEPVDNIRIPTSETLDKGIDIGVDLEADPDLDRFPKPPRSPFRDIQPIGRQSGGRLPDGNSVATFAAAPPGPNPANPSQSPAGQGFAVANDVSSANLLRAGFRGLLSASTFLPANAGVWAAAAVPERPRPIADVPAWLPFGWNPSAAR